MDVLELPVECGPKVGAGEEIVVWTFERVPDQLLRSPCVHDARVELGDLALGQMSPALTSVSPGGEDIPDLRKREAGVLAEANKHDALRARLRVVPALADTLGGWQQANPLVVAERRRRDARAASQLPDRHQAVKHDELPP